MISMHRDWSSGSAEWLWCYKRDNLLGICRNPIDHYQKDINAVIVTSAIYPTTSSWVCDQRSLGIIEGSISSDNSSIECHVMPADWNPCAYWKVEVPDAREPSNSTLWLTFAIIQIPSQQMEIALFVLGVECPTLMANTDPGGALELGGTPHRV